MPLSVSQIPKTPKAMWEAITQLQRDVRELRAARTLENATIGAGGLTVTGGGVLQVVTPSGVRTIWLGALPASYNHPDGSPQMATELWRENGTEAMAVFSATGDPNGQAWTWFDISGNTVLAEDEASAQGLARPYLDASGWFGATEQPAFTTTNGAFTTVTHLPWIKQHPRVQAFYLARASDGATSGEIRLVDDNGVQIGPTVVIGLGGFTFNSITGVIAGAHMTQTYLHWQARTTAGTGSIGVKGLSTYGVQS